MRIPATVVVLLALSGCGLLGKKAGGEDAGTLPEDLLGTIDAAAVVEPPGVPTGRNHAAVARFQTEQHMNEQKMIGQTSTPRTSPGGGTIVATLKTGTVVTRISKNNTSSLIVFPDPNVPTENLMGWVTEAAFNAAAVIPKTDAGVTDAGAVAVADSGAAPADAGAAPADAGAHKPTTCSKAQNVPVKLGQGNAWACRHVCSKDSECTKGAKKCETFDVYNPAPNTPTTTKACKDDQ